MKKLALAVALGGVCVAPATGHDVGSTPITWNREVSRLVYEKCASCHRPGGTALSLMTYLDAQPRANDIKDAVLSRRMPPWGAVKGFGSFRNDQSLTQEQIELFRRWVDGGIRRGNNPRVLPKEPTFAPVAPIELPANLFRVTGPITLRASMVLDGVFPEKVPDGRSVRIVAERPDGRMEPLLWLHEYDHRYAHAFLFRRPLHLPSGTVIHGVPVDAVIALIPLQK